MSAERLQSLYESRAAKAAFLATAVFKIVLFLSLLILSAYNDAVCEFFITGVYGISGHLLSLLLGYRSWLYAVLVALLFATAFLILPRSIWIKRMGALVYLFVCIADALNLLFSILINMGTSANLLLHILLFVIDLLIIGYVILYRRAIRLNLPLEGENNP